MGVLAAIEYPGNQYTLTLVGLDGKVGATAKATIGSLGSCAGFGDAGPIGQIRARPAISTSADRVYFLDGDSALKFMTADGKIGTAGTVAGNAMVAPAFAVSPDNRRIAVSLTDYSSRPYRITLYVEDLGGGNRHDIYSASDTSTPVSPTIWPVGWRGGSIVLAYHNYSCTQGGGPGLGEPQSYHIVDSASAARTATLGTDGAGVIGQATLAGAGRSDGGIATAIGWDGVEFHRWDLPTQDTCVSPQLSPDGTTLAITCTSGLLLLGGTKPGAVPGLVGYGAGWIDGSHLLVGSDSVQAQSTVLDVRTGAVLSVAALGHFVGKLPGTLDVGRGT